jgi:dipeptidyl aminopeptidase/acylaminoacyl peptidase
MTLACAAGVATLMAAVIQPSAVGQPAEAQRQGRADAIAAKLIPREVLFGNPEKAAARISPNGQWLSFLAPVDGVLNVWVAPRGDLASAQPVTEDKIRGIRSYNWAYTGEHLLYTQDKNGDENWHVYATNVRTRMTTDLTPIDGVHAQIEGVSEKLPEEILIGLNDRVPQFHDVWRVNVLTGEKELIQENPGLAAFVTDDDFRVRFALNFTAEGGLHLLQPEGDQWKPFISVSAEDAMTFGPAGFDKTGQTLYLIDSRDRDTAALFALDLESGEQKLIAEDERADVGGVLAHPTEKTIEAVSFTYARREWKIIDPGIADDLEYLRELERGEFEITSRTLDDKWWTVAYILDDGPVKYYLYDSQAKQGEYLFSNRSDLDQYGLVKMHSAVIESRDGLNLVCYYSLPPGSDADGDGLPDRPQPMVLNVHGGPWARDTWGFDPSHQWLANRGYAVLNVNFRGSTGFGKNFINAGNGEWSSKMHNDLIDAVEWAAGKKIADPERVAIMGGSYGGYATLVGLTFTPERFACGVDIVGPSNLVTLLNNMPPYWLPMASVMKERVGDWTTAEGQQELLERSPLEYVERIERPLLIGQGANDPRVKQVEADQIVEAMQEKNIPVTYALYPDEGHGFARPENRLSFYAVAEAFLAEHLGGRFEPVGDDFEGSSLQIPVGAAGVPGLENALENVQP